MKKTDSEVSKAFRQKCRERGLCQHCAKRPHRPNRTLCEECGYNQCQAAKRYDAIKAAKKGDGMKRMHALAVAAGLNPPPLKK